MLASAVISEPMGSHKPEIYGIDLAIAVYVACDDGLAQWLAEVGFAGLGCPAVSSHIDNAAIGEWLRADWTGLVEGLVKFARLNFLVPVPQVNYSGVSENTEIGA